MNKSNVKYLSVDEIIAYLKRTNLPTVLVEGADDRSVYRHLENRLDKPDADILICNGRGALLCVFERRHEFTNACVAYVADKDMWYFTGIPEQYGDGIVFTNGYSIENDLYLANVFEQLLDNDEKIRFRNIVHELCKWFAYELKRFCDVGLAECDHHVNEVIGCDGTLRKVFLEKVSFINPSDDEVNRVFSRYTEGLRGKTLFEALLRVLSDRERASKFSRRNLFEMGAKLPNDKIDRLLANVTLALAA